MTTTNRPRRLNNDDRELILTRVLTHRFKAEIAELDEVSLALLHRVAVMFAWENEDERKLAQRSPERWFRRAENCWITVDNDREYLAPGRLRVNAEGVTNGLRADLPLSRFPLAPHCWAGSSIVLSTPRRDAKTISPAEQLALDFAAYFKRLDEVRKECEQRRREIKALLAATRDFGQLERLWPEARVFYADRIGLARDAVTANLPAIPLPALNAALKLPPDAPTQAASAVV